MKPITAGLPDISVLYDSKEGIDNVLNTINSFMEVNRLPPPAAMPVYKPR